MKLEQEVVVESGNELAAIAASQINYHLMGYFPISPSTQIPETIDELTANGQNSIKMIAADGEHGAFGICYGASTAGGRVFNATSANGLLYAIEQMPVQSHTRFPMVLNIVARSVSGPLDIKCDHSDVMMVLNTGWIILFAKDVQTVYDLNICAPRIAEHKDVRLPVAVVFDGYITSHQKKQVSVFKNKEDVQKFVGDFHYDFSSVDKDNPVTIGAHMNEPDFMDNHYQLSEAMEKSTTVIQEVFDDFAKISGRQHSLVESYKAEDAEVILVAEGSSVNTIMIAVDNLREKGNKVGVVWASTLRPFPKKQLTKALSKAKVVVCLDRQDTYSGMGGNLSLELKAAFQEEGMMTKVVSRVYGLGGRDFYINEAEELFVSGLKDAKALKSFDYLGHFKGVEGKKLMPGTKPLTFEDQENDITVEMGPDGKLKVSPFNLRDIAKQVKRIGPGHGACNGCGIFSGINTFLRGIKGYVTVLFQTGCGMVTSAGYPTTAHRVTYVHNLFQNGAATLSGITEMFEERKRRGEIPKDETMTFIMFSGDGGVDIGMGALIGAGNRNHHMIVLEYDNEGYMNTGNQYSYATPIGSATSTSHVGSKSFGKKFKHKDSIQIMAGTHIPYLFTGIEGNPVDLIKKAAKAQWYAQHYGMAYGKILSSCPLNWKTEDRLGTRLGEVAVKTNFFPLYEIEQGKTHITFDPEKMKQVLPITEWLKMMGKTKHLLKDEYKDVVKEFQDDIDHRWEVLKAKHESAII
jgi:pyruvate ferredoxin oxidoreductase alpha subunit